MCLVHQKIEAKYFLARRNERKFLKDIKLLPSEEFITQHKPLVCDFKLWKVKDTRKNFVSRRKLWKLHEESANSDFRAYPNKCRASSQKDASVEGTEMF